MTSPAVRYKKDCMGNTPSTVTVVPKMFAPIITEDMAMEFGLGHRSEFV